MIEWEKEFDEEFPSSIGNGQIDVTYKPFEVKAFLKSKLEQAELEKYNYATKKLEEQETQLRIEFANQLIDMKDFPPLVCPECSVVLKDNVCPKCKGKVGENAKPYI